MKMVILDGYTLNQGDLDWTSLQEMGNLEVYERTPDKLILKRAEGAEAVFTNKTKLSGELLNQLPHLKYIGVLATGYDVVDIETARNNNIVVTNVPAYGVDSVAQMVFAHILNVTNNVAAHAADVRKGGWTAQDDFCYLLTPQIELVNKTIGIVGYGDIGKATAKLARAFKMNVLIHTRTTPQNLSENMQLVDLDTLLSSADIVSLHCPLTERTHQLINGKSLRIMKKSSILVNCSRGPLIEEEALTEALRTGKILAACLDVLPSEPPLEVSALHQLENCYITPHISWATLEARTRLLESAVANLKAFQTGKVINRIN